MQMARLSTEDGCALLPKNSPFSKSQEANNGPQNISRMVCFFMMMVAGIIMGVGICSNWDNYLGTGNKLFPDFITSYSIPACSYWNCSLKRGEEGEEAMKLEPWIMPPSNLNHNMTDEELFWKASFVPMMEECPFKLVPKVAFMFLTKGPLPFLLLWEKFFHGHEALYSIYVHSLPGYELQASPQSAFYCRQIPSKVTRWGHISLSEAERRLLANALLDLSNSRFILLSESCIPLFNFTTVYNYVIKSQHSFMDSFDDKGPNGRGRYKQSMEPEVAIDQWRKGSQWFEVDRKLAIAIISDNIFYPKFEKFCGAGCFPSEHYFTTMLSIRFGSLLANRSITWVDWSRGGYHPAMFGKENITQEFIANIRNDTHCTYNNETTSVCFLFARKFAPNALDPLLHLSSKLFGSR